MFKNYLKTALRNISKSKLSSFVNISGLAVGMAVALLIGLWVWDELSFDKCFPHYGRLAQVMEQHTENGDRSTQNALPYLTGEELRTKYANSFQRVTMATWTYDHLLTNGDKKVFKSGNFMEPSIIDMLSLQMRKGGKNALNDMHSIILSAQTAKDLFGNEDPIGKTIHLDSRFDVQVTGVYSDIPFNSSFNGLTFIAPWQLFIDNNNWREKKTNPWRNNSFQAFVQIADNADFAKVSAQIKDLKIGKIKAEDAQRYKPAMFLHPMSKWHLYSDFKNGVNTGGRIQFVWLFGIIGLSVLLLACINFMNLSTARSERRAREVGIRKSVGSLRRQLIVQFFAESIVITIFAFAVSILLVELCLPAFNDIAGKQISPPFAQPAFWITGIAFCLLTGIIAGSYPAFYLSSFNPVKVLKGTFKAGRFSVMPRRVLVTLQFTVSVLLIIGTIVVYRQVQYAKDRPVGYDQNRLVSIRPGTEEIHKHFDAIKDELKKAGAIDEMSESSSPATDIFEFDGGFEWPGSTDKGDFGFVYISRDFGKTVGWKIKQGRDFSRDILSDTAAFIINETAARFMNLKNPVGTMIKQDGKPYQIIGVIEDLLMQSPYGPPSRTIFTLSNNAEEVVSVKLSGATGTHSALATVESLFKKYNPEQPFNAHFVDADYARKFGEEERVGTLAGVFAALAVFISCLGLFGLTSFVAEQRTREIGVRKVLGASVFNVWHLLSREFLALVIIACCIACPIAYYYMHGWLSNYEYRAPLSWWIFALAGLGALSITLITVSVQAIKAASANPVKSLRTE